jgi:ferritin-like metal-binding protein YciE
VARPLPGPGDSMPLESMQDLFLNELKDVYNAEKQLVRALPRMAKAAEAPELQQAFTKHLRETEGHVERLERIFKSLGQTPRGKKCKGMEGLVEEGKEILEEDGAPEVIDAALISAAQRVEHYEIAAYGCLRTYAQLLGMSDADRLLQQTLQEEEATDEALTALGEGGLNQAAVAAGAERDDEED